jgi:hypothetical protein
MDWSSVDWGAIANAGLTTASAIAKNRAAGQQAQANAQVPVDQLNQRGYETDLANKRQGLEAQDAAMLARAVGMLQEQAAGRKAPGERASNSVRGDILANAQDAEFSGSSRIPKFEFSGGLRPSMFSDNTRQLGGEMSRQALLDQLGGEDTPFADLPKADYSSIIDAPGSPGGTALPEGGKLDSILQAVGQYGGLAAGVGTALNRPAAAAAPSAPGVSPMTTMPGQLMPTPAPPPVQQPMLAGRVIGNGTNIPRY